MGARLLSTLGLVGLCCTGVAQQPSSQRDQLATSLPDWAGIWEGEVAHETHSESFVKTAREALAHPEALPTVAPPGVLDPMETFLIGRTKLEAEPPYNADWDRLYKARERQIKRTPVSAIKPGSIKACGWDFPEIMDNPFDSLFQIFVTPEETLMLFANGQARHLYTDREHPKPEDLWPTALGNSVGHWEQATLVVDTIERRAGPLVGIAHILSPDLSEQARFTERLHLVDPDTIEDDMSIEDAQRMTRPWTVTLTFHRVKDLDRLLPSDCTENNRFQVVKGQFTIVSHP